MARAHKVGARPTWIIPIEDVAAPEDLRHFAVLVPAFIEGVPDGHRLSGGENFDFLVCSPSWVAATGTSDGPTFARYLLLDEWDPALARRMIEQLCAETEGPDWLSVALKLARFASWEFEGYFDPLNATDA